MEYTRFDIITVQVPYNILSDKRVSKFPTTARYAQELYKANIHLKGKKMKPVGIVYAGGYDGLSIVCWYPKLFCCAITNFVCGGKTGKIRTTLSLQVETKETKD